MNPRAETETGSAPAPGAVFRALAENRGTCEKNVRGKMSAAFGNAGRGTPPGPRAAGILPELPSRNYSVEPVLIDHSDTMNTAGQFSPPPIRPFPFPCPKFPCQIRPRSRTAASRPPRRASAVRVWWVSLGSSPLCVLSDLCGVPLRATTIEAFPENTAEIGRNAERGRADARTAYSKRRRSEFSIHPCRPMCSALVAAPPPGVHRVSVVFCPVPTE